MNNLSYLESREWVNNWSLKNKVLFPDNIIELIIAWSGRRQGWLEKAMAWFAEGRVDDPIFWVEQMGIGNELLKIVPVVEQVVLYNPSLAEDSNVVVKEGIVADGKITSEALLQWLNSQSKRDIYTLSKQPFTKQEAKLVRHLFAAKERMLSRDFLGQSMWGQEWSDWELDTLTARVRRKIGSNWKILTIRGHGFMLLPQQDKTQSIGLALGRESNPFMITTSILPSDNYLRYMNDSANVRKVYQDLFEAMEREQVGNKLRVTAKKVLCVNSYSYDNVDAVLNWSPKAQIDFVHYDERAIDLHKERVRELGAANRVEVWHDDLRESKLKSGSFDLVINDFRLNFNLDHVQNLQMIKQMLRVVKSGGMGLISVVVDGRYESEKYGDDQEKAPININKPGLFQADENLVRRCYTVPYYKKYLVESGWEIVKEFDIEGGKAWGSKPTKLKIPSQGPFYRRFLVKRGRDARISE